MKFLKMLASLAGLYNPVQRELEKLKTQKARHMVKLYRPNGHSFFGPVSVPDREFHFASRQSSRSYLRALWFRKMSAENPLMSRRERRRASRLFACLEYRQMVTE